MTEHKSLSHADASGGLGTNRKNRRRRSETRIVIKGNRDPATISAANGSGSYLSSWIVSWPRMASAMLGTDRRERMVSRHFNK
jgi:hypothetical protein